MNHKRREIGSIPGLAEQMNARQLAGRNNPLNLPSAAELQGHARPNPYLDGASVDQGIPFRLTPDPQTELVATRRRTSPYDADALQHTPLPTEARMGGGEPGDAQAGLRRGLSPRIQQPRETQGARGTRGSKAARASGGVNYSLGGNRGRMGGGSLA